VAGQALADEPHLRALRCEAGLGARGRDRLILVQAHLRLLAAVGHERAGGEQREHCDDAAPADPGWRLGAVLREAL